MDKFTKENENILEKLAKINREIETLQKHEEELVRKRIFEEDREKLKGIINEKNATIHYLVRRVNKVETQKNTLEKSFCDKNFILEERLKTIENKKTETNSNDFYDEKRRLGYNFCEFCEKEFKSCCEKDREKKYLKKSLQN